MRIFREDKGQVLVLTALSMILLLGFVALATDVGVLFRLKRNLQTAADAAATAGALYASYGQSASDAAFTAASDNGVTDGTDGATVVVNIPPASGPSAGQTGFVEVIASKPSNTIFMSLFGDTSVRVAARAVAGAVAPEACIYLMNDSGTDLSLQGRGTIEAPGGSQSCGIYSNSTSDNSVTVNGQGNYVNTRYIDTAGGLQAAGNSNTNPTPVSTNVGYKQSPPQSLQDIADNPPVPNSSDLPCKLLLGTATAKVQSTTYTILTAADLLNNPMTDSGVCFSGNVMLQGTSSQQLTLPPGLYVFTDQVAIGNYVTANGVTLDINGDGKTSSEEILTVTSTTNVQLSAAPVDNVNSTCPQTREEVGTATGGAYCGVLLLAPTTNNQTFNIQWGAAGGNAVKCQALTPGGPYTSGLVFNGTIDAPSVNISLQDEGGYALITDMIVGSLELKTGLLCVDNLAAGDPYSAFTHITLVE